METTEVEEFTPRPYQVDLFERALAKNAILYLPTGAGKTYIAVMLIKAMSPSIRIPFSEGGKRTIFAVNTVPLVTQQSAYIRRHTDLTCQGYSGDMGVDFWIQSRWKEEFEKNQVLVMTAQIFLDILEHGYMSLNQVNLLIFDECHRAVGDHTMRRIMRKFESYPENEQPRFLGTSATLLNSNVKMAKVAEVVHDLEITLHAKVITVDSLAPVEGYGKPKERFVEYRPVSRAFDLQISQRLEIMMKILDKVKLKESGRNEATSDRFQPQEKSAKLRNVIADTQEHVFTQDLYGGSKAILLHMLQLEKMKKCVDDEDTLTILSFLVSQLTLIRKIIEKEINKMELTEFEKIHKYSSEKIMKLLEILRIHYDANEVTKSTPANKFCAIVFVRRRFTAKVLYQILKIASQGSDKYSFIKPDYVVGSSVNPYKNSCEDSCILKWNKEALIRFRTGASNILIATDVVDEGVDIPLCSLVVRYDLPNDFRAYVQSKGRARSSCSNYVMMICTTDAEKERSRHQSYARIETVLRGYLIGNTDNRPLPVPDELKQFLYATEIEPYEVVDANGVHYSVSDIGAISLIHRYCTKLCSSKFVTCAPTIKQHQTDDAKKFLVSITMPITSPLRGEIFGDLMPSITLAKRSAALKACIALHKIGELNDRLLPADTKDIIEDVTHLLVNWKADDNAAQKALLGTYACNRQHKLVHPEELSAAYPQPNAVSYLHVIQVKPTYSRPFEEKRHREQVFYDFLNDPSGFAILSSKRMSQVPGFPLYMNVGPLQVDINVNHSEVVLSSVEINQLKNFHWVVFAEVLGIVKPFTMFDNENMENNYLIVPIDVNSNIDWNIVNNNQEILKIPHSAGGQQLPHEVALTSALSMVGYASNNNSPRVDDYDDWQLVRPNYRDTVYIVTKVCHDMNPLSEFPTDDFKHYKHYYGEKHGLAITDFRQPLLEVKAIAINIDYIKPRGRSASSKRRERDNFEEHLVPELCEKMTFPRLYWLKAMYIPSVIHRLSQLLIAEDLRKRIVRETGLGLIEVANGAWPPLQLSEDDDKFDSSTCSEKSLEDEEEHDLVDDAGYEGDDLRGQGDADASEGFFQMLDSMKNSESETPATLEVDILSLESNVYDWPKDKEPMDLERNIEKIQLIDIDYYFQFTNVRSRNAEILKEKYKRYRFSKRPNVSVPKLQVTDKHQTSVEALLTGPTPLEIMYALTTKPAHDAFNLERLETLGDSFLKYITSAYLFERHRFYTEGRLTVFKGQIVGNRHLFYCGEKKLIPGRLKIDDFGAKSSFIPPCFSVPREIQRMMKDEDSSPNVLYDIHMTSEERKEGELSEETKAISSERISSWSQKGITTHTGTENYLGIQIIKDKMVSDSVEALIGVYLNAMGLPAATKLVKWLGILPDDANVDSILYGKAATAKIGTGDPDVHMPWAASIEDTLGYKFKDRSFLLQAFTHPSYSNNNITTDYQRLEFLGDAIIDFLITVHIYQSCGNLTPGDLTDLRSALVNNITFACLTVKFGLHTGLLAFSPNLTDAIDKFVSFQEEKGHKVGDDLHWILLEEDECNMAEYVEVPKMLGDLFESVIGAIYLDTDKNLNKVWEILYSMMHEEIRNFSEKIPKDPVKCIHEAQGAHPHFSKPEILDSAGSIMVPLEIVIGGKRKLFHGFGATGKQAKRAASKQALKFIHRSLQG
ncbi:endoribonuclease Dicer [Diachasma alloeum]|uniref:endoribonuclease Dicer n=1 Tax=Diachasma alloeum TaxID=454923 RepID=UPI0007381D94|nr:endoribonuclease Dicer [Diachasma alloeum]